MTTRAQWTILVGLTDEQIVSVSTCTAGNVEYLRAWVIDGNSVLNNGEIYPFDDPSFSEPLGVWSHVGTITVNGLSVPSPVPVGYTGSIVYVAFPQIPEQFIVNATADSVDYIAEGYAHYTEAAAIAHSVALIAGSASGFVVDQSSGPIGG